jgi:hypothetical protein
MLLHLCVKIWTFLFTRQVYKDICAICGEKIGDLRQDGTTEFAYTLPCSHMFGNICIVRWLEVAPQQDCPNCRQRFVHPRCGHTIIPNKSIVPPCIPAYEPCVHCQGNGDIARIPYEQERLKLQENALRGMRMYLPRFFGSQASKTLSMTDQNITELRNYERT